MSNSRHRSNLRKARQKARLVEYDGNIPYERKNWPRRLVQWVIFGIK